jgi:hypothetical protein
MRIVSVHTNQGIRQRCQQFTEDGLICEIVH